MGSGLGAEASAVGHGVLVQIVHDDIFGDALALCGPHLVLMIPSVEFARPDLG